MARLKSFQSGPREMAPRLKVAAAANGVARDLHPWRKLYNTKRWQRIRKKVLERDGYTCQQTGVLLIGKHKRTGSDWNAPVADHIIPAHEFWLDGRYDLFWDESNIQAVSHRYHVTEKQKQENRRR